MKNDAPTVVLHGGRIRTLDPDQPVCEAVAIRHETIVATGQSHEVLPLSAEATAIYDLAGDVVIPGLTDSHIHMELYARTLQLVDCEVDSLPACLDTVRQKAETLAPGSWILGHGWNQNRWERYGTRHDLDEACPAHPVFLTAKSLHAAWANTAALKQAGIHAGTSDPPGGTIDREGDGSPSGLLFEGAMSLVAGCVPPPGPDELLGLLRAAQDNLIRMGVTGVHDFDGPRCFHALQRLREGGQLGVRVLKHLPADSLDAALELGIRSGYGDPWIRIGNLKLFADGALGPRTAAMIEHYTGEPGNRGQLLLDAEAITETGHRARAGGISLAVHAIGDLANHHVLDAFERLSHLGPPPALPYRIEHLQLLHPDDIPRLHKAGIVASMQPIHAPSDSSMADRYWGERTQHAYAWRSVQDIGAPLVFGSDAPVESPNPFWGLHAAITRRPDGGRGEPWHSEQVIDLATAIESYTRTPAHAAGASSIQGHLAPGYLADLLVLGEDPWSVEVEAIREIRPKAVMVGGKWRFQAG
jgi:predicted amidohydrolase YtcJ